MLLNKNNSHPIQSFFFRKRLDREASLMFKKKKEMKNNNTNLTLIGNDIYIEKVSTIGQGSSVIRLPILDKRSADSRGRITIPSIAFGQKSESIGVVMRTTITLDEFDKLIIAEVHFPTHDLIHICNVESLFPYEDYTKWMEDNKDTFVKKTPKYSEGQVLYLKPSLKGDSSSWLPTVGSKYEIDVKVVEIIPSEFGNFFQYKIYIPKKGYNIIQEDSLITNEERYRYQHKDFKFVKIDVDASPFFHKNEFLKVFDGFVYNINETVIVKLNEELNKHLHPCSIQAK